MLRDPEASRTGLDRALRKRNGLARGDEAVEAHANSRWSHRHLCDGSPQTTRRHGISQS
jgi:hypothetical protein